MFDLGVKDALNKPMTVLAAIFAVILVIVLSAVFRQRADTPTSTTATQPSGSATQPSGSSSLLISSGQRYQTKSFEIWVPSWATASFTKTIGSDYLTKSVEDAGTFFCLVPICVKNRATSTESLVVLSWYLYMPSGERFEIETFADMYLDEKDKLNAHNIPPGITRCGKLVFLVIDRARSSSYLKLESRGWSFTVGFRVPTR